MRKFLSWYKRKPKTALPRVGLSLRWSFADSVHCRSTSGAERGRKSRIGQCKARGEVQAPRRPAKPTGSSRATGPGFLFLLQSEAGCALPRKVCPWARLLCSRGPSPPDIADGRGSAVLSAPEGRTRSWKWSFVFYCLDSQIYQCGCLRWDKHKEKLSNTYELTLLLWWISGLDFLSLFIVFFVRT